MLWKILRTKTTRSGGCERIYKCKWIMLVVESQVEKEPHNEMDFGLWKYLNRGWL